MAVRKLKAAWWVDFQFNHARYRKRSPDNSRAGAVAYEVSLRQKLARGETIDVARELHKEQTFREFAETWLEDYVVPNNKYSEQMSKRYTLRSSLNPFFGNIPVGQISAHDVERYKAQQVREGFSNKTIRNHLTILNKCLATAYEWLDLTGAPPKIKWPRCVPPKTDYLSPEECELLLAHAPGIIHDMILTALRTGMRQGELKGLQWSSVDWQNRSVAVRHSQDDYRKVLVAPKNYRERHIPLDCDVYEVLFRRKRPTGYVFLSAKGQPLTNDSLNYAITKLCKEVGLRRIGWHTLRHTFASHLAMRGVPIPAVKELLGHASITTTMRYAHMAPSTLRVAIDMLNPKTMIGSDFGQPGVNPWQQAQRDVIRQKNQNAKYV